MTLYKFSLSSILVALVALQNTYGTIHLNNNEIFSIILEEYVHSLRQTTEDNFNSKKRDNLSKKNHSPIVIAEIRFKEKFQYKTSPIISKIQHNWEKKNHSFPYLTHHQNYKCSNSSIIDLFVTDSFYDKKSLIDIKNKQLRI